ncbi:MAG TPA: VanW family protein [Candidatus Bilophila faecipullorum]|uniref:VanW family protein n=1 Tax=Candidatus Bilophila faecipullorum TaxID=2838482 RepID=A0A9D1QYV9_9BACT|nr:VanW family protein [uncultured Bilophila sp.]HIW78169.1 VanW family protein [Candidatus Bilophila faecipullorum]
MARKLFCELCPLTYELSRRKGIMARHIRDFFAPSPFARRRSAEPLPVLLFRHASLIRRRLGNVDARLQENKAVNLALAAPHVSGILIRPGEVFSFWKLVGPTSARKGYREGLMIKRGVPSQGIGGGLCQFTNLIHWMVLHSPLEIVEHHHHDGVDLFPDSGRHIPFGTGTSISYNYLDYRFQNPTDAVFQLLVWTTDTHLRGELRSDRECPCAWHVRSEEEAFVREGERVYRNNVIIRDRVDKRTGSLLSRERLKENHALVMYDVPEALIR